MARSTSAEVIARVIDALASLDDEERIRALRAVTSYFHGTTQSYLPPPVSFLPEGTRSSNAFSDDRRPTPKEFLHEKQPKTDIERIACLAYYLAHYGDSPHFKTTDLTRLNTEAAQRKFSNVSFAAGNAAKAGFLVPAEKGKRQLSATGERYVETLPDRVAAREIMSGARRKPPQRRPIKRAGGT